MNKKIFAFALVLVSTAFFIGCSVDGRYEGRFCYAVIKNESGGGIFCEEINENVTEALCNSLGGQIIYSKHDANCPTSN